MLYQIAQEMGLPGALGKERKARLAPLMVLAQVIRPMGKRAVVGWGHNQAVYGLLGLGVRGEMDCDENALSKK